jgi:hypothetical protein
VEKSSRRETISRSSAGALACACVSWAALAGAAFAEGIEWRPHVGGRVDLQSGAVAPPDPAKLPEEKITRNLDYVALSIESLLLRDLAGFDENAHVILGVELTGVTEAPTPIKTIIGITQCKGRGCVLRFPGGRILAPFRYLGREITFTLVARSLTPDETGHVREQIEGRRDLFGRLRASSNEEVDDARTLYEKTVGAVSVRAARWRYSWTLYPADEVVSELPQSLLWAGRHVALFVPPPDAPEGLRDFSWARELTSLRYVSRRLVRQADEREYERVPYFVLMVRRYKRYPGVAADVQRRRARIVEAIAARLWDKAQSELALLNRSIVEDQMLTQPEKDLERLYGEALASRLARAVAVERRDGAAERSAAERELTHLTDLEEQSGQLLEKSEVEEIRARRRRLWRKVEEWGREAPVGAALRAAQERAKQLEDQRRVAEVRRKHEAKIAKGTLDSMSLSERAKDGFVEVAVPLSSETDAGVARAQALALARREAIRKVTGQAPGPSLFTSLAGVAPGDGLRLARSLGEVLSRGLIVEEQIVGGQSGGSEAKLHLRAKVVARGFRRDHGFTVTAALDKAEYLVGERATLKVRATRGVYLYAFAIDSTGAVIVLSPVAGQSAPFVAAGTPFELGAFEHDGKRIYLRATLPKGQTENVGTIKVLGLRHRIDLVPAGEIARFGPFLRDGAGSKVLLTEILRKLGAVDPDRWAETSVPFVVRAK